MTIHINFDVSWRIRYSSNNDLYKYGVFPSGKFQYSKPRDAIENMIRAKNTDCILPK